MATSLLYSELQFFLALSSIATALPYTHTRGHAIRFIELNSVYSTRVTVHLQTTIQLQTLVALCGCLQSLHIHANQTVTRIDIKINSRNAIDHTTIVNLCFSPHKC